MKHIVIVVILVILLTFGTYVLLQGIGLLPAQASVQAVTIDRMFNLHIMMISFLFSLIIVFMGYSIIVFRQKKGDEGFGKFFKANNKLEIIWTILPLGTVIFFSYLGAISLAETRIIEPQALNVDVTAGQWYWSFEYPEYGITSDTLYLPVDRQVKLSLTSVDVIHSFWVPEFRVKQDVLPGENLVKELRFTPTEKGEYTVRCAELCGGAHAYMNSPVIVVDDGEFTDWIDSELGNLPQDPVSKGKRLVENNGCLGCHSVDGSPSVGPTWAGLFGSEKVLLDGSIKEVNEDYLHTAIVDPNIDVPEGFPAGVMPSNYADLFSEEEIQNMISFIQSLK
jgi:cytochrome c oxidase subunit 2